MKPMMVCLNRLAAMLLVFAGLQPLLPAAWADDRIDFSQKSAGDYRAGLPDGTSVITSFGERPVFSPDGSRIAFIGKSYGDAFEYDIASGSVRNLTGHMPHAGFLRIHYLPDGNFLLLGPRRVETDRMATRIRHIELWYLNSKPGSVQQPLGEYVAEGLAVSRTRNRIAWAILDPRFSKPEDEGEDFTVIRTAEVKVSDGIASLHGTRDIYRHPGSACVMEAQDVRNDDQEVMVACYDLGGVRLSRGRYTQILNSSIMGISVDTSRVTVYHDRQDGTFSEMEGIAPSGDWAMVECGPGSGEGLDLCRLNLDKPGNELVRLTRVLDYGKYRVSNPVVNPDETLVAFQFGYAEDEAGVGRGLLLMPLPRAVHDL